MMIGVARVIGMKPILMSRFSGAAAPALGQRAEHGGGVEAAEEGAAGAALREHGADDGGLGRLAVRAGAVRRGRAGQDSALACRPQAQPVEDAAEGSAKGRAVEPPGQRRSARRPAAG
jgi:hypothetical protein